MNRKKEYTYQRVSEAEYNKAIGQLRMQVAASLNCFRCYGLDPLVEGAITECIELAEQFAMRVRGKPQPIRVRNEPAPRPTD